MTRIGIESAFEVLQRARALEAQGKNVIHLEIGQPDFPTPAHIKEAAKRALDEGWTGYGPTPGFPDFREAIASYISTTRGIKVSGQNVVVVPGGKPIMFFAMLAVVEPGDEVIYPNPGFPIYESVINFLGATPVPIPLVESRGFSFDLDVFESKLSSRTKMVVLNSPANPTGGVIPREDLKRIAELLRSRDVNVRRMAVELVQSVRDPDGELWPKLLGFLREHSRFANRGHEIHIGIPARHNVNVQMVRDSCSCRYSLINADVITLRFDGNVKDLHGPLDEVH